MARKKKTIVREQRKAAQNGDINVARIAEDLADGLVASQRQNDRTIPFEKALKKYGYRLDSSNRVVR